MGRLATNTRSAALLFVGFAALYVAISRGVFVYGDDVLMYQVTESLVQHGNPAVSAPTVSASTVASTPGRHGQRYAKYGLGQSLVAAPAYVASDVALDRLLPLTILRDPDGNQRSGARVFGTALTNAVIGGAVVGLLYLLALECGYAPLTAWTLSALLGGATLLPHYAATFLSEPLLALCLLGAVWGMARAARAPTQPARAALVLSGACAGLAVVTRVAAALFIAPIACWLLWLALETARAAPRMAARRLLSWGVPCLAGWATVAFYDWWRFGNVTTTGYGAEAHAYTTPLLTGLRGLLLSPGRGVFWYDPPLLLALVGAWWFARRRPALALTIVGVAGATLVLYARYYAWDGGGVWGPRFLVPLLPLLLLPAGDVVERARAGARWACVAVGVAGAFGLAVLALGILVPFDTYVMQYEASPAALHDALWTVADSPLVVHAERLHSSLGRPDIAAIRYHSPRLAALSLVSALLGALALLGAWRAARQAESGA